MVESININNSFINFIDHITWHLNVSCPLKILNTNNDGRGKRIGWLTNDIILERIELKNLYWVSNNVDCANAKLLHKN